LLARGAAAVGIRGAAAGGASAAGGAAASGGAASAIGTASRVAMFSHALGGGDDKESKAPPSDAEQYTVSEQNSALSRSAEFQTGGSR
jgi:hypothetical protein